MAFDGVVIASVRDELSRLLIGGRVDKVAQPERDEVHLLIRCGGKNHRLLMSASASVPRIHLTEEAKENPEKAPMFCMLLRKHIAGGKVVDIRQPRFERVLELCVESADELGDRSVKVLAVEIMGRHSNLVLRDARDRILGSVKHVDFTVSSVRQVIPGMLYELPPSQGKKNPLETGEEELLSLVRASEQPADRFVMDAFTGIGPLNARELPYRCFGSVDADLAAASEEDKKRFARTLAGAFAAMRENRWQPVLLYKEKSKPWEFNALAVTQYEGLVELQAQAGMSRALEAFYSRRDHADRMSQKSASLLRFVENNIARCRKKLAIQEEKCRESEKRDRYKLYGDLIISNLHAISPKAKETELANFYDGMRPVKIPLLPELGPAENANRYYRLYQKAKTAERMSMEQMRLGQAELAYLESVQDAVVRAENEHELRDIQGELAGQGYAVRRSAGGKIRREIPTKPHRFVIDGFEVFVGKNNLQNDALTLKEARGNDMWFHVKDFAGSHTVVRTGGRPLTDDTVVKVAKAAAYFSKAKDSANVPVDYTAVKNVKKPGGAKPGMVIYVDYSTVNVRPEKPAEEQG